MTLKKFLGWVVVIGLVWYAASNPDPAASDAATVIGFLFRVVTGLGQFVGNLIH